MESTRFFEQLDITIRKLPHQKLSNLLAVIMVVYLAYVSSTIVWQLVPVESTNGSVTVPSYAPASNSSSSAETDVTSLLSLNLFGKVNQQKPVVKPKVDNAKSAPKTRLNVTLTGLVADANDPLSKSSVAIIDSSKGQNTYGVDEKIDGTNASVYQIFIDRVILYVSGRYETLMLDGIEFSTTIPGTDNKVDRASLIQERPAPAAPRVEAKEPVDKKRLDQRENIELSQELREQRQRLFEDPKKLLDVIRIRPFRRDGQLQGYRLSPGKDAKLFNEVGLKRNDLATTINGYDLTDMQQALSVMAELKTMTEATITVVRDDASIDIILAL
ncbi:MAG: type II secretion system protein GspC [Gammaproteobacteria bacterium]|nr:type II secretion system protein GspC [Gammaproteobacteria bacterium]